jgi:hypothetical protein
MARPVLADILSGAESWDTTINQNNDKIATSPFPILLESSKTNLDNNWDPALFDACIAVVWDGTPGNPVTMYASRHDAWEPVSTLANTGVLSTGNMVHVSDAAPDNTVNGSITAGVWTTRPIRVEHHNTIAGCVTTGVPTSTILLPEATYWLEGVASAFEVDDSVIRFRQISGVAQDKIVGRRMRASTASMQIELGMCGLFTNATGGDQTYRIEQLCTLSNSDGMGRAVTLGGAYQGRSSVWSDYKIWQVS